MHLFHPPQSVNGLAPENTFYVADSANMTVAEGYIVPTYHPYLFPERPINLFLSIRSKGPGRDMLLGALLARAQQIHEMLPNQRARVFAQVNASNTGMLAFYLDSGFDGDDWLDVVKLGVPNARASAPMGYNMDYVPLTNQNEALGFIQRMNVYHFSAIQPVQLQRYMQSQHFMALYLSRGSEVIGEIAFAGNGAEAKLIGLYTTPNYRNMGLAKTLISTGMKLLGERGVTSLEANVIKRNPAQVALATSCHATFVRRAFHFPGINMD